MRRRGTNPTTVLHTIDTGGPGGAETLVVELASRLDRQKFRSLALVPDQSWISEQLRARSVPVFALRPGRWFDPRPLLDLVRLIRSERVDLIHSQLPSQNFYASVAGTLTGRPAITTYHGPVELEQSAGLKGRTRLGIVKNAATWYSVVCDQMRDALLGAGFDGSRITRIYNGVDADRYIAEMPGTLRAILRVTATAPIVGMIANIRAPKGYEFFIRAARLVADRTPEARFVSIGDAERDLSPKMEALVRELELENRFTFLGFRADVAKLLRDFDVFVLSSTSEGFPFAAIEAMAAGKPSVMTRCGGPEEIVEDGVTGYLVPVRDPVALAQRITDLLASPDRAQAMGAAARARILREFTVAGMLASYEQLYQKLVAGYAGG